MTCAICPNYDECLAVGMQVLEIDPTCCASRNHTPVPSW